MCLCSTAANADDSTACVQAYLSYLGYNVGPVDGLLGPRTGAAAQAYLNISASVLPPLDKNTTAAWCSHTAADAKYQEFLEFDYNGFGVLPKDVVFSAVQSAQTKRNRACGRVLDLDWLERQEPIYRISGFNSRMDNFDEVPGAKTAEKFALRFGRTGVAAYVRQDREAQTRLVRVLARWAEEDAFLGTISCVKDNYLISSGKCTEWQRPDGQDKSGMKDATGTTFLMAGLVRTYLAFLFDHERKTLAKEHAAIASWINNGYSARLKRPDKVYFGLNMGWYWPAINLAMVEGRPRRAKQFLRQLERGLGQYVYSDGSIKNRTTRGDRALWYQFTSIGEVVVSLEMLRAAGMQPAPEFEERLHAAVDLFLRALDDYSVIHPWARQRHKSSYMGKTQDWNRSGWPDQDFGGTWLHIYPYRFPDHPNSAALRRLVSWYAGSATEDSDLGFGAGCIYNLAAGRVPG